MQEQNDILLTEAIERYINGEMGPDERMHFENLRKENSEVDQMVVSHTMFLQKMNRYNEWQKFHHSLNEIHTNLSMQGKIDTPSLKGKARLIYLINRYKRVASIAASIAGLTALLVTAIVWSFTPKSHDAKLEYLNKNVNTLANKSRIQDEEIRNLKLQGVAQQHANNSSGEVAAGSSAYNSSGTGFIIDKNGYLVTNAHVVKDAQSVAVQNGNGTSYNATILYADPVTDVAVLKITDKKFKDLPPVPYSFTKKSMDLGEPIFTLGFPRDEIVYGQGYLSSKTGYNGDTLSCQIEISANRGNSGSPVLNTNGEIVGIVNGRQIDAQGFVFALKTANIFKAIDNLNNQHKGDDSFEKIKLNAKSYLRGLKTPQQAAKINDYILMVKVN